MFIYNKEKQDLQRMMKYLSDIADTLNETKTNKRAFIKYSVINLHKIDKEGEELIEKTLESVSDLYEYFCKQGEFDYYHKMSKEAYDD